MRATIWECQYSRRLGVFLAVVMFVCACQPISDSRTGSPIQITVNRQPINPAVALCDGRFVAHDLDHITTIAANEVRMFDSNGSGLAINDLDNDGDLDMVLANLDGPNAIFWNEGGLNFRKEEMPDSQTRAVNIVDINGDSWQDIIFASRRVRPLVWINNGNAQTPGFTRLDRFSVSQQATSMAWADLDGDGDLDVVVGAYDAELQKENLLSAGGGGVIYYENQENRFVSTPLASSANALAILLVDVNEDGHLDIWVGNDFETPDQVWLWSSEGWQAAQPFAEMSHSTMSLDAGDLNNDGRLEYFTTDMKPYSNDPETQAAWAPLMQDMHPMEGDPQMMENMLQVRNAKGEFENRAGVNGLSATGWSWSSKLGDLDNDGFLDVYAVNGMASVEMFGHLPNNELVEENQVLRNDGQGAFIPVPAWGLNSTASGRGMSMADLDGDGDLDIVVNNLRSASQLYENRLCSGESLQVDLIEAGSRNSRAIGARLILHTNTGDYWREVRSGSGYLSGDPARVHFGFPSNSELQQLEIRWPDGTISQIDDLVSQTFLTVTRHAD